MTQYIWQQPNWPLLSWDEKRLLPLVSDARLKQGRLIQKVQSITEEDMTQAQALIFEEEALKTARIEGERYDPRSVRSSVRRHLGLDYAGLPHAERHIDGLVDVLFDATSNHGEKLIKDRLCRWHVALFPTGQSALQKIDVGKYRNSPMGAVSGAIGREHIHFEAPPAKKVPSEMKKFLRWWNDGGENTDGILRAAIAHLHFVTIHPFDDGNGRLARAVTDMALAQDNTMVQRYYSLSGAILSETKSYYRILEQTQKGDTDITPWLAWFLDRFTYALNTSDTILHTMFQKTEFWRKHSKKNINDRQRKVVNTLLDAGREGYEGGITTRKYVESTKISRATAIREIKDLVEKGLLVQREGKGRNVSYTIHWEG